jgi:hypothetical protein
VVVNTLRAVALGRLTFAAALAAVSIAGTSCAFGQKRAENTFAQQLLREVVQRHPEIKGMEMAGLRGDGCVTIAATDAGDIGDTCDGKEKRALRSGEPDVEAPTRREPAYIIAEALHDADGALVGLLITDIAPNAGEGRDAVLARARAIRQEIEARIPSGAHLIQGTPASAPAPAIDTSYDPRLDPSAFTSAVTNPYFPLVPGTTFHYRGTGAAQTESTVVTVTYDTRIVMGIAATVVRDQVFEHGELAEDTYDWYAQDVQGNVWYLGEETKEYRDGRVVSTEGSWQAGVGGAKPGIIMWGDPAAHIGETYWQEYLVGVAEDRGKVLSVRDEVVVPFGRFQTCVRTEDTTPLEPQVREHKYYCRGIGLVKEAEVAGEGSELVAVRRR